jgi:ABC-2 type transport system permease protein/oleandomycin transport system permease protein
MRHGWVLTKRNLTRIVRSPQLIVASTIQPVMFVLLFNYVFGGAIELPGPLAYISYLIPGIVIQTAVFAATNTAIGLTDDLQAGIIDRFRSLPIARSAVLVGRTVSDGIRVLFLVILTVLIGMVLGFRFEVGLLSGIGGILLAGLFAYSFTWVAAVLGLATKTPEAAQAAAFIPIFPFTFASSAFVPVESMPGWLQTFSANQPVTAVINAVRALFIGVVPEPGVSTADLVIRALVWMAVILVVFVPWAVRLYRNSTS